VPRIISARLLIFLRRARRIMPGPQGLRGSKGGQDHQSPPHPGWNGGRCETRDDGTHGGNVRRCVCVVAFRAHRFVPQVFTPLAQTSRHLFRPRMRGDHDVSAPPWRSGAEAKGIVHISKRKRKIIRAWKSAISLLHVSPYKLKLRNGVTTRLMCAVFRVVCIGAKSVF